MGKLCNGCKTSLPKPGSLNVSGHGRGEAAGALGAGGLRKSLNIKTHSSKILFIAIVSSA